MHYVYVLRIAKDGKLYKRMSKDPKKRLRQHNAGKVRSTKGRAPFVLVCRKAFSTIAEAREHEVFLKSRQGAAYLLKKLKQSPGLEEWSSGLRRRS